MHQSHQKDLQLFGILTVVGVLSEFANVQIPHTEVFIEGRWAFGYIGFALLRSRGLAVALMLILCVPFLSEVSFYFGFLANLAYALPGIVTVRYAHHWMVKRWGPGRLYVAGLILVILLCYQLFNTPTVWGALAILDNKPFWPQVLEGWRTQPFFLESVLVAFIAACAVVAYLYHERLAQSQKRLEHINKVLLGIRNVNQLIVAEESPRQLIERACMNLTETMGYQNAWIALLDPKSGALQMAHSTGHPQKDFQHFTETIAEGRMPGCMEKALQTKGVVSLKAPDATCRGCPLYKPHPDSRGVFCSRLESQGITYGMLAVSMPAHYSEDPEEQALFLELANDLGFALQKIESRQHLDRANQIIKRSPVAAFIWKNAPDWPVLFAAGNTEKLFGRSNAEFTQPEFSYAQVIHPDDRERIAAEVRDHLSQPDIQDFTHMPYRIVRKDGTSRWVQDLTFVTRDSSGAVQELQGILLDITETQKAQKDKEDLRDQLHQSQKMESVGRLAGGVAHDFNNMLNVILGNTEILLQKAEDNPAIKGELEEIRQATLRSANLTRQLLAFARKQQISPRILDINDTIAAALKMLMRLIGENIHILWKPGNNVSPVHVDPAQLDQVLANLIVNARDAIGKSGEIVIKTSSVNLDATFCRHNQGCREGDYVCIAVTDNGEGMTRETQAHLFEPFYTTKGSGEGTGLGLATVYGIIKQNNGYIRLESAPRAGTTFYIYLPAQKNAQPENTTGEPYRPVATKGSGETLLFVEDEEAILSLGRRMLERIGYRVLASTSAQKALQIAEESQDPIALLITDVVMPEMNGKELSNRLESIFPGIKSLYISGYTAEVIARHGILPEGMQFLQKPFGSHDLANKVREALGKAPQDKIE